MPWNTSGTFAVRFSVGALTANREVLFPDSSGLVVVAGAFSGMASTLTLHRNDAATEGGQLNFNRAADDGNAWAIDAFGAGSVDVQLRFIDLKAGTVPMIIGQSAGTVFVDKFQVSGTAAFNGPLQAFSTATLSSLAVVGNAAVGGNLTAVGNVVVGNNLQVIGTASINTIVGGTILSNSNISAISAIVAMVGASAGSILIGGDSSGARIELGQGATVSANPYIDFHAETSQPDFSTRLVRVAGVNGEFQIAQVGTGALRVQADSTILSGAAIVTGALSVGSNAFIAGTMTVGNVVVAGTCTVLGNLTASDAILNTLRTVGNLTVGGNVVIAGFADIRGTLTVSGEVIAGANFAGGEVHLGNDTVNPNIELGTGNTTNANPYIDFHASTAQADFSARFIRNAGDNAEFILTQNGTGAFRVQADSTVLSGAAVITGALTVGGQLNTNTTVFVGGQLSVSATAFAAAFIASNLPDAWGRFNISSGNVSVGPSFNVSAVQIDAAGVYRVKYVDGVVAAAHACVANANTEGFTSTSASGADTTIIRCSESAVATRVSFATWD